MRTTIVDSFTDRPFAGNPAGVTALDTELPDAAMLQIAQELNLVETAFVRALDRRAVRHPVLLQEGNRPLWPRDPGLGASRLSPGARETTSSTSKAWTWRPHHRRQREHVFPRVLDAPSGAPASWQHWASGPSGTQSTTRNHHPAPRDRGRPSSRRLGLHGTPRSYSGSMAFSSLRRRRVAYDFHSRYFWPWSGTNEDHATGGPTFLTGYWAERLGKTKLKSPGLGANRLHGRGTAGRHGDPEPGDHRPRGPRVGTWLAASATLSRCWTRQSAWPARD